MHLFVDGSPERDVEEEINRSVWYEPDWAK